MIMKTNLFVSTMAIVMSLALIGCKGNNNPDAPGTEESVIKSTTSVSNANGFVIEAIMKDGTRQYYKMISPTEVGVTNYYAYYVADGFKDYDYKGNVTIPESIKHEGTAYTVTTVLGGGENRSSRTLSAFFDCKELKCVTLPRSITKIEKFAIKLMKEYEPIEPVVYDFILTCLSPNPPELGQSCNTVPQPVGWDWAWACATLKVPAQSIEAYKAAWGKYTEHIVAIE